MSGTRRSARGHHGSARTAASSRGLVPVLAMVLLTGLCLAWAGTHNTHRTPPLRALSSEQVSRSMSCVTGLPDGRAVLGTLAGSVSASGAVKDGVAKISTAGPPLVIRAVQDSSADAYASQSAGARGWYAAQPCPGPAAQRWFVGAGGSQLHSSMLTLANGRSGEAIVDIAVWGRDGKVAAPGLRGVSVGKTPVSLDLAKVAPSTGELALSVTAVKGLVSASLVDTRSASAALKPVVEFLPSQAEPATDLVLGGLGAGPGATKSRRTLLLFNAADASAVVKVELIGARGSFASTGLSSVSVPPEQVVSVPVATADFADVLGVRITSPQPVVAGLRSELGPGAGGDAVLASPLGELGDQAVLGVPRRADAVLRLFNPTGKAMRSLGVRLLDSRGRVLEQVSVSLAPGAGQQLAPKSLRRRARMVVLTGGGAARAVLEVRAPGGAAALPFTSATGGTRVPAVYPGSVAAD